MTCNEPFTTDNPVTRGHVKDVRAGGTPSDGYIAECRRCNYGWRRAQKSNTRPPITERDIGGWGDPPDLAP